VCVGARGGGGEFFFAGYFRGGCGVCQYPPQFSGASARRSPLVLFGRGGGGGILVCKVIAVSVVNVASNHPGLRAEEQASYLLFDEGFLLLNLVL